MLATQPASTTRLTLAVPRLTGTHGDDLVAWGLAIVLADACGTDVVLEDNGDYLRITAPFPREIVEQRIERGPPFAWRLRWLASTEKKRLAPAGVRSIDRDQLREAWRQVQKQPGWVWQTVGDAPTMTAEVPAWWYPRYEPLTNPGTQWDGYNGLVEAAEKLATADGLRLILSAFDGTVPLQASELERHLVQLRLRQVRVRWRNPAGFLYPSLNKGPTMRVRLEACDGAVGDLSQPDWLMTDRRDRGIVELCLAYVGYFSVAQVLGDAEGRTVFVPMPVRVRVPRILGDLDRLRVRSSTLTDYQTADAGLAYAQAALSYLIELQVDDPVEASTAGPALRGAAVTRYWQPSGNTYAPLRSGSVALPAWLRAVRGAGFSTARDVLDLHRRKLRELRGFDERRLSSERRHAIAAYARSLDGDVIDWLRAVAAWFLAVRGEGLPPVWPWRSEDVRRIAVAEAPDLQAIVGEAGDDNAFTRVAGAIRHATVNAHFARQRKQTVFEPQYDLITTLGEAADRHTNEFLRELFAFAAHYNDETMRRNEKASQMRQNRPMLRADDLAQVQSWVSDKRYERVVPMALLAFGSSVLGRDPKSADDATVVEATERAGD